MILTYKKANNTPKSPFFCVFVFYSPSTSEDNPLEEHQNSIIIDYQLAEKYGREQQHQQQQRQDEVHCGRLYDCSLSILDLISKVISL